MGWVFPHFNNFVSLEAVYGRFCCMASEGFILSEAGEIQLFDYGYALTRHSVEGLTSERVRTSTWVGDEKEYSSRNQPVHHQIDKDSE